MFHKQLICSLQEDEIEALILLAPYWGLLFDEESLTLAPSLTSKNISVNFSIPEDKNNEATITLSTLLAHTEVHVHPEQTQSDLSIHVHSTKEQHSIPVSIHSNHIKYRLKYMKNYYKDMQSLIHRGVWLPNRHDTFSITFNNFSLERQMEIISYLIIQFFLRNQMLSISHISFNTFAKLIQIVLKPINPQFAHLQRTLYNMIWPETPPELTEEITDSSRPFNKQELQELNDLSSTFNPFRRSSPSNPKKINPFQKKETTASDPINPFKRNTHDR